MFMKVKHVMSVILPGGKKMIKKLTLIMIFFAMITTIEAKPFVGQVKYISLDIYYVNLGKKQGVNEGDTLSVIRNRNLVGKLRVIKVANYSCACKLITRKNKIKLGDQVVALKSGLLNNSEILSPQKRRKYGPYFQNNKLKGSIDFQTLWFNDMSNTDIDYSQQALVSKIEIERLLNTPLRLSMRWRTRRHHRETTFNNRIATDEWRHHIYELGLIYEPENSPVEFAMGRFLDHRVRGIGFVDGALFSVKLNPRWRIGLVGGTEPGLKNLDFRTDEQKFGVFINHERGDYQTQKISSTLAFSGRYHSGEVSREFFYLQNNYWRGGKFSIYQSVEIDINRGWKRRLQNASLQISNFFLSLHYTPYDNITVNLSYDARKNIRFYENRSIPDSLFDETIRQGIHTGFTIRLPRQVRFSGNFGVRLRKGHLKNTISASGALYVRNLLKHVSMSTRLSYFSSMFTTGYRPSLDIRIPLQREFTLRLGGGSYIYKLGNSTSSNHWLEVDADYYFNRWFFGSLGYRYFITNQLKSGRFFLETGVQF